LFKSKRILTRGFILACAATVGRVGRWVSHDGSWNRRGCMLMVARMNLVNWMSMLHGLAIDI
jgi:hypothetical protein